MSPINAAARRLLVLCDLVPLSNLTQDEVEYLFRRAVEDAAPGPSDLPGGVSSEPVA
jgi:hypothetical protein